MKRMSLIASVFAVAVVAGGAWAESNGNGEDVLITEEQQRQYSRQMKEKLSEWKARVESATERGAEKAGELGEAGKRELEHAWRDARSDWEKLQEASGETWEKGKRQLDDSMDALQSKWRELNAREEAE